MEWRFWRWSLATQIIAGLVLGAILGLLAGSHVEGDPEGTKNLAKAMTNVIQPLGRVFLKLIFMMVIPLMFSAIVLGVMEMGDLKKLGRVGAYCLLVTIVLSGASVLLGLVLVNGLQPGKHLSIEKQQKLISEYGGDSVGKVAQAKEATPLAETLLNLIPANPLAEAVNAFTPNYTGGGLMAVMAFSLFFGIALLSINPTQAKGLVDVCQGVFAVSLTIVGFAMKLAPFCVACLGFVVTAKLGLSIVQTLGYYIFVVLLGLALHQFGTYSLVLWLWARKSPLAFFREIREVMVTAFGTSSSNATLPVSLRVAEQNLKLPSEISRFVLTVGASANQNGTALYEGVTVLFLAQVFGVHLELSQQVMVAFMCILAGVGTAGVPGGSLPLVVGVLVSVGVQGESIAIILGVDRVLDMCRTTLNVTGDLVCATVVAKHAQLDPSRSDG
jgi:DAACS family dicarboxylate/amino acid:cation (Na+ or H+) symporter